MEIDKWSPTNASEKYTAWVSCFQTSQNGIWELPTRIKNGSLLSYPDKELGLPPTGIESMSCVGQPWAECVCWWSHSWCQCMCIKIERAVVKRVQYLYPWYAEGLLVIAHTQIAVAIPDETFPGVEVLFTWPKWVLTEHGASNNKMDMIIELITRIHHNDLARSKWCIDRCTLEVWVDVSSLVTRVLLINCGPNQFGNLCINKIQQVSSII